MGGGGHIGCRTLARFVAEQASLDAVHHGDAYGAASKWTHAECAVDDDLEHMRHLVDVRANDKHGQQEVADGHEWHNHTAHISNAVNAAKGND